MDAWHSLLNRLLWLGYAWHSNRNTFVLASQGNVPQTNFNFTWIQSISCFWSEQSTKLRVQVQLMSCEVLDCANGKCGSSHVAVGFYLMHIFWLVQFTLQDWIMQDYYMALGKQPTFSNARFLRVGNVCAKNHGEYWPDAHAFSAWDMPENRRRELAHVTATACPLSHSTHSVPLELPRRSNSEHVFVWSPCHVRRVSKT